jgi:hypothetical protein
MSPRVSAHLFHEPIIPSGAKARSKQAPRATGVNQSLGRWAQDGQRRCVGAPRRPETGLPLCQRTSVERSLNDYFRPCYSMSILLNTNLVSDYFPTVHIVTQGSISPFTEFDFPRKTMFFRVNRDQTLWERNSCWRTFHASVLLVYVLLHACAVLKADFHDSACCRNAHTCFFCWNHTSHNGETYYTNSHNFPCTSETKRKKQMTRIRCIYLSLYRSTLI